MGRLDSLSFDLTSSILDYVELEDFRQLRLTSSKIRESTEEIFVRQFFRVVSVLLIKDSILALEEISQHRVFRRFVQRICLYTDHVCPEVIHGPNAYQRLQDSGANALWFDSTGRLLGDALRRFPQCTELRLSSSSFPPRSEALLKGEYHTELRRHSKLSRPFGKHMWQAALEALRENAHTGAGGMGKITSLTINLDWQWSDFSTGNPMNLPKVVESDLVCALGSITSLSLDLEDRSHKDANAAAKGLLMHLPNLKNLCMPTSNALEMMRRDVQGGFVEEDCVKKCKEWFEECQDHTTSLSDKLDAAMRELPDAYISLGGLEELELDHIVCGPVELAHGLLHYGKTLRKFNLYPSSMYWYENPWPELMRVLHERLPRCGFGMGRITYEDTVDGLWRFNHGPLEMGREEEFVEGKRLLEDFRIARGDMGSPGDWSD